MSAFANVRCGEVPSLHALAVSPNVLKSHTIPPTATFVRYITVPPAGPHVYVMEVANALNEQFMFNFRRPRAALGSLTADLRDTPGGRAAIGPISHAFGTSASQEDLVRKLGSVTYLEDSPDMEAWIVHIRSE
ncbi:hypothetical protein J3F83DRAFT_713473 [Trichoderma novae-zelandiae]